MKQTITSLGILGLLSSLCLAGTPVSNDLTPCPSEDAFAQARRPISNPTLFDLALPTTNIRPLYIRHELPDFINSTRGKVRSGRVMDIYALQFEIAMNERLSFVATKDGYVESDQLSNDGFANIGGGVKYAFILDPASGTAVSGTATIELPVGDEEVLQGEGDGAINLIASGLKLMDAWQFAGAVGTHIPFSHEQTLSGFASTHVSYEVCKYFIPLVELNWFHVLDAGDGGMLFPPASSLIEFETNDFFNIGAANAHRNRDLVTAAFGFRSRITESVNLGAAYEIPLTNEEDSVWDQRLTIDMIWRF